MNCTHRGKSHGHHNGLDLFHCNSQGRTCSIQPNTRIVDIAGTRMLSCTGCPLFIDPDAPVTLDPQPIIVPERHSDKIVVTLAVGAKFRELLAISRPTFQKYAAKCGADYLEIIHDHSSYAQGEKLALAQLFDHGYSQVLYLDADCVVMDSAPDLFATVPREFDVAIHDDQPRLPDARWVAVENARITDSQGWQPIPNTCYNTGVMLVRDRRVFDLPPLPIPRTVNELSKAPQGHFLEQASINCNIHRHGLKVYDLGTEWNDQYWRTRSLPERGSHIYHWSSCNHATRVSEMAARRDGVTIEAGPRSEFAPCSNLGDVIRADICQLCGNKGKPVTVRSCDKFGECSSTRYKQVGQPHICDRQCSGFTQLVQLAHVAK